MTVHIVPGHRPLPLAQCVAVLRGVRHRRHVPHVVADRPFYCLFLNDFIQSDFGGQASLEPNISQKVRPLDWGELEPYEWIPCPDVRRRAKPSEEDQRGKLLILARTP